VSRKIDNPVQLTWVGR